MSSTNETKKRKSSGESLYLLDLPTSLLADVASYLTNPSKALLAAALTAPSSGWRATNWECQPSMTSESIISSQPKTEWSELDFVDNEKDLAFKLTDDDVGAALKCINAKDTITKLKLTGCVNIIGHGLKPLSGSSCLEQIDLSFVKPHTNPDIKPAPLLSKVALSPILDSIIDTAGCSLKQVQFPEKWSHWEEWSGDFEQFLMRYKLWFTNRRLSCSICRETIPSINANTLNSKVCYNCLEAFCGRVGCKDNPGQYSSIICECCSKCYCCRCSSMEECSECLGGVCRWCLEKLSECETEGCENINCERCSALNTCTVCKRTRCSTCVINLVCQGSDCSATHCEECYDGLQNTVKECSECTEHYCWDCRVKSFRTEDETRNACNSCLDEVACSIPPHIQEDMETLRRENSELRKDNRELKMNTNPKNGDGA